MMETPSYLEELKKATSRADVALILGIKLKDLTYLLFKKHGSLNYKTFHIPKKSGGSREINAPKDGLKDLQRSLATLLLRCVDEISVALDNPNTVSHGFMPGRSIFTNAYPHRQKRYVFNVDLRDFFGSITFQRLRGFFIADQNFSLHKDVATVLAQIACHEGKLPQGSPSSPILSNLIGQILDMHLVKLAKQNGCIYTRYADDLTFSTNKRDFPIPIAKAAESGNSWEIGKQLRGLIAKSGFEVNDQKTRMHYKNSRQEVTGLVTNSKVNVRAEYRHDVRAKVHHLLTKGHYFDRKSVIDDKGVQSMLEIPGTLNQLHGRLGFIHTTDKFNWAQMQQHPYNYHLPKMEKKTGNESMYLRFLLYKLLYANTKPMLICEGKTDNVYLSRAIHTLHAQFPSLTTINNSGKRVLSVQLFKYAHTSTGEIFGNKSGGSAGLAKLIETYFNESSRFKAPTSQNPVIFVIDNDLGAAAKGALYDKLGKLTKNKPTGTENFYHAFGNVYVVATPLNGNSSSCIEDLFSSYDKATVIDGKTFDPTEEKDPALFYNKATFAYKVVEKSDKIDYSMFVPFIQNIVDAISHYAAKGLSATVNAAPVPTAPTPLALPKASSAKP